MMDDCGMTNRHDMREALKQRIKRFALESMKLCELLPRSIAGQTIARQLARSATSVGANYRAVCRARSDAEFVAKMSIVVEEADESAFWLELITEAGLIVADSVDGLLKEANELIAIFASARKTASTNRQSKIVNRK